MTTLQDKPVDTRPGEELDAEELNAFLEAELDGFRGPLKIRQYPAGFSNLTYSLEADGNRYVLRRPPFGTKAKTAHDMGREFRMLQALRPVYPYCPEPLVYCDDESVIGSEFFVMQHIAGVIVRRDYPESLALGPDQVRAQFDRLADAFAELHKIDVSKPELAALGKPSGYARRQVDGWSKRYRAVVTDDVPDFERAMQWLDENLPPEDGRAALVHNDFRLDNVVWDESDPLKLIGVLDWEMATLGDPLMDLGGTLGYWVEPGDPDYMGAARLMPTTAAGAPTRAEFVARYTEASGRPVQDFGYYQCFGLFRLAVIGQQIYFRYKKGQTKDPRFAHIVHWVRGLEKMANRVIQRDS